MQILLPTVCTRTRYAVRAFDSAQLLRPTFDRRRRPVHASHSLRCSRRKPTILHSSLTFAESRSPRHSTSYRHSTRASSVVCPISRVNHLRPWSLDTEWPSIDERRTKQHNACSLDFMSRPSSAAPLPRVAGRQAVFVDVLCPFA